MSTQTCQMGSAAERTATQPRRLANVKLRRVGFADRPSANCQCAPTAFSLVEVTLALGVASFCLIALFGLLPVGLNSNQLAVQQTAASGILSAATADLLATRPPSPQEEANGTAIVSQQFCISVPVNPLTAPPAATTLYFSTAGQCSTDLGGSTKPDGTSWAPAIQPVSRLTVTFLPNGANLKATTFVNLRVTWPAAASLATASSSVQTFVALDRN